MALYVRGQTLSRRGEGGEAWLGKKDTGYLYKALMVARRPPKACRSKYPPVGARVVKRGWEGLYGRLPSPESMQILPNTW